MSRQAAVPTGLSESKSGMALWALEPEEKIEGIRRDTYSPEKAQHHWPKEKSIVHFRKDLHGQNQNYDKGGQPYGFVPLIQKFLTASDSCHIRKVIQRSYLILFKVGVSICRKSLHDCSHM
jgi:hypothetical protein